MQRFKLIRFYCLPAKQMKIHFICFKRFTDRTRQKTETGFLLRSAVYRFSGQALLFTTESSGYTNGNETKNLLPTSSFVSNQILPFAFSTMPLQIARPRPVPEDLVVKLGAKIFGCITSGIP